MRNNTNHLYVNKYLHCLILIISIYDNIGMVPRTFRTPDPEHAHIAAYPQRWPRFLPQPPYRSVTTRAPTPASLSTSPYVPVSIEPCHCLPFPNHVKYCMWKLKKNGLFSTLFNVYIDLFLHKCWRVSCFTIRSTGKRVTVLGTIARPFTRRRQIAVGCHVAVTCSPSYSCSTGGATSRPIWPLQPVSRYWEKYQNTSNPLPFKLFIKHRWKQDI